MTLTLAIITRKRPQSLRSCLESIYNQSVKNFTILIIDNDNDRSARPVYEAFSSLQTIPIIYVNELNQGYVKARNCALHNCHTRYLGFVDDDCVLDKNWVKNGLMAIKEYNAAFVSGTSIECDNSKLFTTVEKCNFCDNENMIYYNKSTLEINYDRLDTKNIILNNNMLKSSAIYFDDRFNTYGGEDVDLGFQIKYKNLKGYYIKNMIVYHNPRPTYRKFMHKAFCYGYSGYNLYNKWQYHNECIEWSDVNWFKFFNFPNWKYTIGYTLYKLKYKNIYKIIYFFILTRIFNFCFLRGTAKSKKYFLKYNKTGNNASGKNRSKDRFNRNKLNKKGA